MIDRSIGKMAGVRGDPEQFPNKEYSRLVRKSQRPFTSSLLLSYASRCAIRGQEVLSVPSRRVETLQLPCSLLANWLAKNFQYPPGGSRRCNTTTETDLLPINYTFSTLQAGQDAA